jgi:phosphomannomutase/phosphoglucomutase
MLDPSQPQDLGALGDAVIGAGADLGLAFDADGDRLGVVDAAGTFIAADRVLMLLAADVLARAPGSQIVYDVKSSHRVGAEVLQRGGRPVMWKSGHSFLKQKVRELGAPLGGELSGHIVFADRWNGFDDAFYAGARLLEVLAADPRPSTEVFADFRVGICTPELFVPLARGDDAGIMQSVLELARRLDDVEVNTIDGLCIELDDGWGLIRASNTRPGLVFRFEADDQAALSKIQDRYRRMLARVAPDLSVPF